MISFFTQRSKRYPNREIGAAGIVRGFQIAEKLGPEKARTNPEPGTCLDDVCIFIKQYPPPELIDHPSKSYIDVVDHFYLLPWLKRHPDFGVIASTRIAQEHFRKVLHRENIIYIPQQHCNFDNEFRGSRRRRSVKTVGIVGSMGACELDMQELSKRLAEFNMEVKWLLKPRYRSSVVRFLRYIDVQLIFRERSTKGCGYCLTALKLENAGSFKIPTVAYPEPAFDDEFTDAYIKVYNMDEVITAIKQLKDDKDLYTEMATRAYDISQKYHIDEIIKNYEILNENNSL